MSHMRYRVMLMVYHFDESAKDAQGIEFEFEAPVGLDIRQHVVRGFLSEDQCVKSIHVEPVVCQ